MFENVLKKMPCLGNRCNDSCLSVLQRCVSFRKDVSNVFRSFFLKVFVECGFEK